MRAEHQAECALALLSGALFYNANEDVLTKLFPNGEVIFTLDSNFASTAKDSVTWYWVDDSKEEMAVNANNTYPIKENMVKLFKIGNSLASHSFGKDAVNGKNNLLAVINMYEK